MSSQEWRNYCLWRKHDFATFDSLDSRMHNSMFTIEDDDSWNYVVTNGGYLTDVVNDYAYAQRYARQCEADEILMFDFAENVDSSLHVAGYDILDGGFRYSLLTNFGNDITIVNECLGSNGLIHDKNRAMEVHRWFLDNMPDDNHVVGSRLFVVYNRLAQQVAVADLHQLRNFTPTTPQSPGG
jgi:hypothetical protein